MMIIVMTKVLTKFDDKNVDNVDDNGNGNDNGIRMMTFYLFINVILMVR